MPINTSFHAAPLINPYFRDARKRTYLWIALGMLAVTLSACVNTAATQAAQTAQAQASLDAAKIAQNSTATAQIDSTSTQAVQATGTSAAQSTLDKGSTATARANERADQRAATATAHVTATVQYASIVADFDSLLQNRDDEHVQVILQDLRDTPPFKVLPTAEIEHKEDEFVACQFLRQQHRNFALQVTFYPPFDRTKHPWDFGVLFRDTSGDSQYRLGFTSDSFWEFDDWEGSIRRHDVAQSGKAPLITDVGVPNKLTLVVIGKRGLFILNNKFVSHLDVSNRIVSGEIVPCTGLYEGDEEDGASTKIEDLKIWRLPREE